MTESLSRQRAVSPAGRAFDLLILALMAAMLWCVVNMALVSAFQAHPDEKEHVGAGQYYMHYWDMPRAGDSRTMAAYSKYGASYLDQLDVVYILAGKFAAMVRPFAGADYLALRFFNVSLFALLMVLYWRLPGRVRICFLPLFLSPQIWYVFSYFNGDALPLTLGFLAVWLLAGGEWDRPSGGSGAGRLAALALVFGLLSLCKMNYYVLLGFFGCAWLAVAVYGRSARMPSPRKVGLALALAGGLFAAGYGAHLYVNRTQAPDVVNAVAESLAKPDFKPSKQAEGTGYWGLNMRAHGVTFTEMFTREWAWHFFTQRSSLGLYGHMDILAPLLFYRWIWRTLLLFTALMLLPLVRRGLEGRMLSGLFLAFAFLTVAQSFWHSWTADFQAQGRYMFPILCMMSFLLWRAGEDLGRFRQALWSVGLVLWGMSFWSFTAVGLAGIAR